MTSGASATSSATYLTSALGIAGAPANIDPHVAAIGPAQFLQALQECCEARLSFLIVRGHAHEHADAPHALALLRACRQRTMPPHPPPSSVMNSRRFISLPPRSRTDIVAVQVGILEGATMSALGHKQTFAVQKAMSALRPIADMCSARANVR